MDYSNSSAFFRYWIDFDALNGSLTKSLSFGLDFLLSEMKFSLWNWGIKVYDAWLFSSLCFFLINSTFFLRETLRPSFCMKLPFVELYSVMIGVLLGSKRQLLALRKIRWLGFRLMVDNLGLLSFSTDDLGIDSWELIWRVLRFYLRKKEVSAVYLVSILARKSFLEWVLRQSCFMD